MPTSLGNSLAGGQTSEDLVDDSSDSGIDWNNVFQGVMQTANGIVSRVTQPSPYTQLPNGTVITSAGQVVPGTSPSNISGGTLLIVFILAALVFFLKT
jgi:hypothetical protein